MVPAISWPSKRELFGLGINPVDYEQSERLILEAATAGRSLIVTHLSVHGVVTATFDRTYRETINHFDLAVPDGQPVRWALNCFQRAKLTDRVYGPELMLRLCRAASGDGIGVYLYGSTPEVLARLRCNLQRQCQGLKIVGCESPPVRPLLPAESSAVFERINASGAGLVFIGLGCPRQDIFAHEHRDSIKAVQLCVGAAFDFHAGTKKMAPRWMQRRGLEWLFRMTQEPRRLGPRYLGINTVFIFLWLRRMLLRA